MKRILFCAGLLTLVASCTESELDSISEQAGATKGISFEGTLVETPTSRGDLKYDEVSGKHNFFWYAETDNISIWSTNTDKNNTVNFDKGKVNTYKATQSKDKGVFTALDNANILKFQWTPGEAGKPETGTDKDWAIITNEQFKSQFIATYPSTVTLEADKAEGKYEFSALPVLAGQTQTTADGQDVTKKIMMISLTKAIKENSYDAVGEKIDLKFARPFTAVIFQTTGIDKEYADIFGDLASIDLTANGYDMNADGDLDDAGDIKPSYIDYGSTAHYLYDSKKPEESKLVKADGDPITDMSADITGAAHTVKLTLSNEAAKFKDGSIAYMAINKVNREAYKENKETMTVKFSFAQIDLIKTFETNANWPAVAMNNKFVGGAGTTLDINSFPYLVTKTANARTLIVNKGSFSQIFNATSDKVKWNDGADQEYDLTQFTNIISKVELSTPELALLKNFTNVTSIKLAENPTIPTETFKDLTALKTINLPKATTIAKGAFDASTTLTTVIMPAYKFADETINPEILKKASLVTLDMSGVDQMSAAFPAKGLTLSGYTALEKVTVKDGLLVGASSFSGCAALETITGAVEFRADGAGAFMGCVALEEINIKNTIIPADAFKNCAKLVKVLHNKVQVLPTSVGTTAFSGCEALEEMNLSLATEIGQQAFKGCTELYGVVDAAENKKKIMYVGAATIPFEAFHGCVALEYVHFMAATSFDNDILKGCTGNAALKEIKFKQAFTLKTGVTYTVDTFGASTNLVKLFINPTQDVRTFDNNDLILKSTSPQTKVTFLSITKE